MIKPEYVVADALRTVALRLELAMEEGRSSTRIDANDLLETLLSVADELDPPCGLRQAYPAADQEATP